MTETPQIDFDARPLYRLRRDVAYGKEKLRHGSLHRLGKIPPEGIERMLERRSITEVQAPPLAVLPGWSRRAVRLEKAGVGTVTQLLGAHVGQVAEYMRVKDSTVLKWQRDALDWLQAPEARG